MLVIHFPSLSGTLQELQATTIKEQFLHPEVLQIIKLVYLLFSSLTLFDIFVERCDALTNLCSDTLRKVVPALYLRLSSSFPTPLGAAPSGRVLRKTTWVFGLARLVQMCSAPPRPQTTQMNFSTFSQDRAEIDVPAFVFLAQQLQYL